MGTSAESPATLTVARPGYNDLDIMLTRLSLLASTNAATAVPHRVVHITLIGGDCACVMCLCCDCVPCLCCDCVPHRVVYITLLDVSC